MPMSKLPEPPVQGETSLTIFECLMVIRVRKAAELLTFTGMSLAEISCETGFVNLTHFNRVFTKHVMIPPAITEGT